MLAIKSQVGESASKKRKTMADDPKEPSEAEQNTTLKDDQSLVVSKKNKETPPRVKVLKIRKKPRAELAREKGRKALEVCRAYGVALETERQAIKEKEVALKKKKAVNKKRLANWRKALALMESVIGGQ